MFILHHHSTITHDGKEVMGQRECGGFRDHVGEQERLTYLRVAYEALMADKPDEVLVNGNLHDGYSFRAESVAPCGHPVTCEVALFIDQERCDTRQPEAPVSAPMELVFSQVDEITRGL